MRLAVLALAAVACGRAPDLVTDQHIFYSDGLHNENTELLALDDRILLVFRGGETGQIGSDKAHLNVYASMDQGVTFTKQAEISAGSLPGMRDIRDPKLVSFGGRVFLYAISRVPGGHYRDLYGEAWTVRSESTDHGVTWSAPVKTLTDVDPMTGSELYWGFWRITHRKDALYAVGYDDGDTAVAMFTSTDGLAWTKVSTVVDRYVDVPSETELQFFGADLDTAVALVRMDDQGILQDGQTALCVAHDPFTTWSCRRRLETRFDGPTWLSRKDGRNFVVARKHLPCTAKRTAVYELRGDLSDVNASIDVCELAELKSAGDTAYTALAPLHDDTYLVSWYSSVIPSSGDVPWLVGTYAPSDIWLAQLNFAGTPKECTPPPAKVACPAAPLPVASGSLTSGDFLLALAPVIYPSSVISLRTTVTVNGGSSVDLHLQPLDAMTKMPIGQSWDVTGVTIAGDGTFAAHFAMEFLPGDAFPLVSDPFLSVYDLTLTGRATGADRFCGNVSGYAQVLPDSPSDRIDLAGSTFGAVRISGATLPEPVTGCTP